MKDEIIASIRQRILDEHRKHSELDWARLAATKIYRSHIKVVCDKCGHDNFENTIIRDNKLCVNCQTIKRVK